MEKVIIKDSPFNIKKAKILQSRKMTDGVKFFEIALMNGETLNHEPGQFVMVSLFGIGKSPFPFVHHQHDVIPLRSVSRRLGRLPRAYTG